MNAVRLQIGSDYLYQSHSIGCRLVMSRHEGPWALRVDGIYPTISVSTNQTGAVLTPSKAVRAGLDSLSLLSYFLPFNNYQLCCFLFENFIEQSTISVTSCTHLSLMSISLTSSRASSLRVFTASFVSTFCCISYPRLQA
jgi:hypothetical protein